MLAYIRRIKRQSLFNAAVGSVAVVHTATLADFLVILLFTSLDDKLDVYDLCLAGFPVADAIQRTATAFAVGRLMLYDPVRCADRL